MARHDDDAAALGLAWGAALTGALAIAWGVALGVRPVLAWGVAQTGLLAALWLYPRLVLRRVRLDRDMTRSACEDDAVPVRFELENASALPLFCPEVVDRFAPDKVPVREAHVFPWLPGRSRAGARYEARCYTRRGDYVIGPATVRVLCPLGLFSATRVAEDAVPLVVYPAIEPLPPLPQRGASRAPSASGGAVREPGDGGHVLGVREYRAGDPLRRVHWPTTARRGRLAIVEHERQVARGTALFLDLNRAALRGLGRQSTLETAVRACAALAAHHLLRGDRVTLHGQGRAPVHVPLAGGRDHLARILEALAHVRPDGERAFPDAVRDRLNEVQPGQAAWLIAGDLELDGDGLIDVVGELRARGARVVVVLLDPATFRKIFGAPTGGASLARVADACALQGATVHTVGAGEALAVRLVEPWAGRRAIRIASEDLAAPGGAS